MRVAIDARKIADFGIGTYIRGLLGGLVALHDGKEYLALAPPDAQLPEGVEHVVVDAPHYSMKELMVVGKAAERAGADLLHAPHYVVPFTRLPAVVTIHDLIHLHQPLTNPLAPFYARVMIGRAIRKAACVVTVSEAVRQDLVRELGAKNVVVTPNGIDDAYVRGNQQPATGDFFVYAGNDKPHKNVPLLVDAFARVRRELPGVTLVLTGGRFERYASRDGVVTPGFISVDELAALYRGALALVLPSAEEGFGLPAAEAMACGTAVITSRAPALVEITGDAALHVDANADELAEAMLRVARDASLRASLGAKGRERARLFTWLSCARVTSKVYEIVEQRGTTASR